MIRQALLALVSLSFLAQGAAAQPERLPDGIITKGQADIAEVWLTRPTTRYAHAILGDDIEAGGIALRTKAGDLVELILARELVFEDRQARLADLDGDGRDEIIVVLSHENKGAALAVYNLVGSEIRLTTQTPFIGRANRWLNPAGIADLDGDGLPEVAIVVTPHIGGRLQIWKLQNGQLTKLAETAPVSNHIIGEREQNRSAVVKLKNGRQGLVVEDMTHAQLLLFKLNNGNLELFGKYDAGGRILPGLAVDEKGRRVRYRTGPDHVRFWRLPD